MFERLARKMAQGIKKMAAVVVDVFATTGRVLKRTAEKAVKGIGDLVKRLLDTLSRAFRAVFRALRRAFGALGSQIGLRLGLGAVPVAVVLWLGGCSPFGLGGGADAQPDAFDAPIIAPAAGHVTEALPVSQDPVRIDDDRLPSGSDESEPDAQVPIEIVPLDLHSGPACPNDSCGAPSEPGCTADSCTPSVCDSAGCVGEEPVCGSAPDCKFCVTDCATCAPHVCPEGAPAPSAEHDGGFFAPDSKPFDPVAR